MTARTISTRFSSAPLVLADHESNRIMVYSEELHETFVYVNGHWRVGRFTDADLKENFKKVNKQDSWRYLKLAMAQVGFI